MSRTIFLLGGARSGKSRHALQLGEGIGPRRAFVATAQALDEEMARRIRRHQASRSESWRTYEEPLQLGPLLEKIEGLYDVIVVDCLTLWVSNLLSLGLNEESLDDHYRTLLRTLEKMNTPVILISNEVGGGIVPANALARRFCDLAGLLHQQVAALADEVFWFTAGLSLRIKPGP